MSRTRADVKPEDQVLVFDQNGRRGGQPAGGWPGTVVSKGPKWITISYTGAFGRTPAEKFGYDGYRAGGFRHFELPEEYAVRQRLRTVHEALREHGVRVDEFHPDVPPVEKLEAMLAVLESTWPEYTEDLPGLQAKILAAIIEHVKGARSDDVQAAEG